MRPARRSPRILLATLAVLLAAAGCSASNDDGGDKGSSGAFGETEEAPAPADANQVKRDAAADLSYGDTSGTLQLNGAADGPEAPDSAARKVIAQGDVSLESDDVQSAVTDVQHLVDHYFGEITERETTTDKDGDISNARLLLRIPVKDFDAAFVDLQKVGELKSSNTGKEDVTTKVIDTRVRIRAQRLSLARVEALFDRAQSISDIIRIESQVSRRQADLESLERRLNYLNNQTSMSTITVNISLPPPEPKEKAKDKKKPEETGFLAGLDDGWHALQTFGSHVATLAGRLLPFAGVLLIVGGPVWLLVRRSRRRDDSVPAGPAPADA
jgi:hypothetical protein